MKKERSRQDKEDQSEEMEISESDSDREAMISDSGWGQGNHLVTHQSVYESVSQSGSQW